MREITIDALRLTFRTDTDEDGEFILMSLSMLGANMALLGAMRSASEELGRQLEEGRSPEELASVAEAIADMQSTLDAGAGIFAKMVRDRVAGAPANVTKH